VSREDSRVRSRLGSYRAVEAHGDMRPRLADPARRESPETVEGEPERAEPRSATVEAHEGAQRRSWWRRLLGEGR
jgi:hypothetical protein